MMTKAKKYSKDFQEFLAQFKSDVLYFQDNEKQIEWDGYPCKFSRYYEYALQGSGSDEVLKADKIYQAYIRQLERRKKLERLNSIYAGIKK